MDTGYVHLLDDAQRGRALAIAADVTGGRFVAGAYVGDAPGARFDLAAHLEPAIAVAQRGGTPVVFPSYGLHGLDDHAWVDAHAAIGARLERFIAFELGEMFLPQGRVVSLDAYRALLDVPQCVGAKHSSLRREAEWRRLDLRDAHRPDFRVFTGNDLAIDMVMYGSDYLLGLATFAPDLFAARDRRWRDGDASFHELNDGLQYLGHFAFRPPVPAYRHDAAMFLRLRGWSACDATPAGAPQRDESDLAVLADIAARLAVLP
jgi:dihydrodipicolinate synthase/N-acetylneuraminate lyase